MAIGNGEPLETSFEPAHEGSTEKNTPAIILGNHNGRPTVSGNDHIAVFRWYSGPVEFPGHYPTPTVHWDIHTLDADGNPGERVNKIPVHPDLFAEYDEMAQKSAPQALKAMESMKSQPSGPEEAVQP